MEMLTGFSGGASGKKKNPACQCRRHKRHGFDPWVGKIPWRRAWQPISILLPGEAHGQRSLAGYSQQGRKESDTTEVTYHAHMEMLINLIVIILQYLCALNHHVVCLKLTYVICQLYLNKADNKEIKLCIPATLFLTHQALRAGSIRWSKTLKMDLSAIGTSVLLVNCFSHKGFLVSHVVCQGIYKCKFISFRNEMNHTKWMQVQPQN